MEVQALDWKLEETYEQHDVVRVDSLFSVKPQNYQEITSNASSDVDREIKVVGNQSRESNSIRVRKGSGYSISASVKLFNKNVKSTDNFTTLLVSKDIEEGEYYIDGDSSIGAGVGLKFKNKEGVYLKPIKPRKVIRLIAYSELDDQDSYKLSLEVEATDIPDEAYEMDIFVAAFGLKTSGVIFSNVKASNSGYYFYCVKPHGPNLSVHPNMDDGTYWTQDFVWRPSYNSKTSFLAKNESFKMGDGYEYVANESINSLPLELDVSFTNRTDKETKAIIHFLQEKLFVYDSIFSIDHKGDRLISNEVKHFNFEYSFPYKKDLKFTCVDFSHSINYRNNNNINAKFICISQSTLNSVEGHDGYDYTRDVIIPIVVNGLRYISPDRVTRLDTFALEPNGDGKFPNDLESVTKHFEGEYLKNDLSFLKKLELITDSKSQLTEDELKKLKTDNQWWNLHINLKFKKSQDLEVGDTVYIQVNSVKYSIFSVGLIRVKEVLSDREFVTEAIPYDETGSFNLSDIDVKNNGYDDIMADVLYQKIGRHPLDCLSSRVLFPDGFDGSTGLSKYVFNKNTQQSEKRKIITKDYRMFYLEEDVKEDDYYIYVSAARPVEYSIVGQVKMSALIPEVLHGRSSMYINSPNTVTAYPWNKNRDFDFRPNNVFTIPQTPEYIQAAFINYYNKKYNAGINSLGVAVNLSFEQRSDEEAEEILLFLESHLGFKSFSFQMPRPYLPGFENNIKEENKSTHAFYCPSWTHEVVFKNNHTITATFIESKSANLYEDSLQDSCVVGGNIFDPIVPHATCTLSSSAACSPSLGFVVDPSNQEFLIEPSSKETDVVFVLDNSRTISDQKVVVGDAAYTKYDLVVDSLKKIVTGYDGSKFPGTKALTAYSAGQINLEDDSLPGAGSNGVPPWPVTEYTDVVTGQIVNQSLISKVYKPEGSTASNKWLSTLGYDIDNLKRFNTAVEERGVNMGISLVGNQDAYEYPMDKDDNGDSIRILDLPDYPNSFDKKYIYDRLSAHLAKNDAGRNHLWALSDAVAQLFNAKRSNVVNQRIIFYISDFYFSEKEQDTINSIVSELKTGGRLSKRRPRDEVLKDFGIDEILQRYAYTESWRGGYSNLMNPDYSPGGLFSRENYINYLARVKTENDVLLPDDEAKIQATEDYNSLPYEDKNNPTWYNGEMPTMFFPVGIGASGEVSSKISQYAADYTGAPGEDSDLQLIHNVSAAEPRDEEGFRIMQLTEIASALTEDNGFQNLFSVTIYNCGPHSIKLHNTIIGFENDKSLAEYSTEVLKHGIVKDDDRYKFTRLKDGEHTIDEPMYGTGGQYYSDPKNEKMLTSNPSNIVWHSFNTEHEVYRQGKIHEIDGGWGRGTGYIDIVTDEGDYLILNESEPTFSSDKQGLDLGGYEILTSDLSSISSVKTSGVSNPGVMFKGAPIRAFKNAEEDLQIIDYNIAGEESASVGDYSHMPVLKSGESIDLFFGIRYKDVDRFEDRVQLFFHTEDMQDGKMDCYAQFQFNLEINDSRNTELVIKTGVEGAEQIENAEDALASTLKPTVEQISPAKNGLCDPYGLMQEIITKGISQNNNSFGYSLPVAQIIWDHVLANTNRPDIPNSLEKGWYKIFQLYDPFMRGLRPVEDNDGNVSFSLGSDAPFSHDPGNRPAWGCEGDAEVGEAARDIAIEAARRASLAYDGGNTKYAEITKPYKTDVYEAGLPSWLDSFKAQLTSDGPQTIYTYGTRASAGGTFSYGWNALPYSKIENLQQFFDCLFMEVFWFQMAPVFTPIFQREGKSTGLLWPQGSSWYGQPKQDQGIQIQNNFTPIASLSTSSSVTRYRVRCKIGGWTEVRSGAFQRSWGHNIRLQYKDSLFYWMMKHGWNSLKTCPGGILHEESNYWKNNIPSIVTNSKISEGAVYISSKRVGSTYDLGTKNFLASEAYDIGSIPKDKLFGPWAIIHPVSKFDGNVSDLFLYDQGRFSGVCKFAEYEVPYNSIQSIAVNAPVRVILRNSGEPESPSCGSGRTVFTRKESREKYGTEGIIFDGIGPFVLHSDDKVEGMEDWRPTGYNKDTYEFWDKYQISSAKQFLSVKGLADVTKISIQWLGSDYITWDRERDRWLIKQLPDDFCYDENGNRVSCSLEVSRSSVDPYRPKSIKSNIIKKGSFYQKYWDDTTETYRFIDYKNGEVQYGKVFGNEYGIDYNIYPGGKMPEPLEDPDLSNNEVDPNGLVAVENVDSEAGFYDSSNTFSGVKQACSKLKESLLIYYQDGIENDNFNDVIFIEGVKNNAILPYRRALREYPPYFFTGTISKLDFADRLEKEIEMHILLDENGSIRGLWENSLLPEVPSVGGEEYAQYNNLSGQESMFYKFMQDPDACINK
jgi:phage-related protein